MFLKPNPFFFLFLTVLLLGLHANISAQSIQETDTLQEKKVKSLVLPVVYYTPETRGAAGVASIFSFRLKNEPPSSNVSSIQLGGAYTQEKQVLFYLPYRIYIKNDRFLTFGELGYYRYRYFFFGVGEHDPDAPGELYDVNYPRIRWRGLRKVTDKLSLGFSYDFDQYKIVKTVENGLLSDPELNILGRQGSTLSVPGLTGVYDSRDNQFYPSQGFFSEMYVQGSHSLTGSSSQFLRINLDHRQFHRLSKNHILALNFVLESAWGEVPFNATPSLGGTRRLRGYYEGKFRDNKMLLVQSEYRLPLFWRFKLAAFGGIGFIAPEWSEIGENPYHYAYGMGLRFLIDKKEKIHIRIDYGIGQGENTGFYLTIGEAI